MVPWRRAQRTRAFTLVEVLLSFIVIAVLAALLMPVTSRMNVYAARVKSISNLRQIGVAARLYANDHNQQLPGQPSAQDPASPAASKWPILLCAYLSPSDPRVFLDSTDLNASTMPLAQVISNQANNTAFIYNGFDDLAVDNRPPESVALTQLNQPAQVALMGLKQQGAASFYVDLLFQPLSVLPNLLNTAAFDGGSHYLFADGSVRLLTSAEYSNTLWLVDKSLPLPLSPTQ